MTKYRKILRLKSLGINQTGIAGSCGYSRATVRKVLNRAKELDIVWPLKGEITDTVKGYVVHRVQKLSREHLLF
jgi:hypothetical protein